MVGLIRACGVKPVVEFRHGEVDDVCDVFPRLDYDYYLYLQLEPQPALDYTVQQSPSDPIQFLVGTHERSWARTT